MKKDEKFIQQQFGKENPFRVPEGYFEGFTADLMDKLPQQEHKAVKVSMMPRIATKAKPYLYAAAVACIAVFTASLFFNRTTQDNAGLALSGEQATQTSTYEQQVDDYLMLDNEDIYAYVAGYK